MSQSAATATTSRSRVLTGVLAVSAAVLALQMARAPHAISLPLYDFAEYWASGRLVASGENPYDPIRVGQLEQAVGRESEPLLMWNPPWTLPLVLPFGLLPARVAHLLWLLLSFGTVLLAADAAWLEFGGPPAKRGMAWLLAFSFVPTFLTLYLGQIAAVLLAGAVLFLRLQRRGCDYWAGAATLLLAVKPHLFSLFWIALCLWAIASQHWRVLAGAAFALTAASLVALLFDPALPSQYRAVLTATPPAQYRSPTLGTVLRLLCGEDRFGLQFVALVPGLVWFVPMWLRHRHAWDWGERLPALLFASLLTAPYGAWPFDLIVLLVPLLRVAANAVDNPGPVRPALLLYAVTNAAAVLCVLFRVDFFWWIWLTPALLVAYVAACRPIYLVRHRPA